MLSASRTSDTLIAMQNDPIGDGWKEWSKYVLKTLDELSRSQRAIEESINRLQVSIEQRLGSMSGDFHNRISQMNTDLAMLKLRASFWGAISGALTVGIAIAIKELAKLI